MFGKMIVFAFVIILAEISSSFGDPQTVEVTTQCIPTSNAMGPCHECLCTTDGVYHCREIPCLIGASGNETAELHSAIKECEPYIFYRQDNIICTCDALGFWISTTCKNKFQHLKSTTSPNPIKFRTNINCSPNEFYLADCNICKCNPMGLIDFEFCTNRACPKRQKGDSCTLNETYRSSNELCICSDINFYIDKLCIKVKDEIIQKVDKNEITKLVDVGRQWKKIGDSFCEDSKGNTSFSINCNNCTCDEKGRLSCTKQNCSETIAFRSRIANRNPFYSLPELKNVNSKCIPGVRYRHKCNTCVCSNAGFAICASMICVDDIVVDKPFLGALAF